MPLFSKLVRSGRVSLYSRDEIGLAKNGTLLSGHSGTIDCGKSH